MSYFFSSVKDFFSTEEQNAIASQSDKEAIEKVSGEVEHLQIQQNEFLAQQERHEEEASRQYLEINEKFTQVEITQEKHEKQIRASKQIRSTVYEKIKQSSCGIEDKIRETEHADELIEFHSHFCGLLENRILTLRSLASEAFVPHSDLVKGAHSSIKQSSSIRQSQAKSSFHHPGDVPFLKFIRLS